MLPVIHVNLLLLGLRLPSVIRPTLPTFNPVTLPPSSQLKPTGVLHNSSHLHYRIKTHYFK